MKYLLALIINKRLLKTRYIANDFVVNSSNNVYFRSLQI